MNRRLERDTERGSVRELVQRGCHVSNSIKTKTASTVLIGEKQRESRIAPLLILSPCALFDLPTLNNVLPAAVAVRLV